MQNGMVLHLAKTQLFFSFHQLLIVATKIFAAYQGRCRRADTTAAFWFIVNMFWKHNTENKGINITTKAVRDSSILIVMLLYAPHVFKGKRFFMKIPRDFWNTLYKLESSKNQSDFVFKRESTEKSIQRTFYFVSYVGINSYFWY